MGFFQQRNERARKLLRALFPYKRQVIYGRGEHESPYLIRYRVWGIGLHIFYRGDADPDCHDHPFDFHTFPLTPYVEEVLTPSTGAKYAQVVPALRWTFRPAEHTHRVLGRFSGLDEYSGYDSPQTDGRKIITIVIFHKRRREWGFWQNRVWVHWKRYLYGNTTTWID